MSGDIHERAVELLREHGEAAFLAAAMKADAALARHDLDGERLWTAVVHEIEKLERLPRGSIVQ